MFAVIKTGNKQYKVAVGDHIKVELLDLAEGVVFDIPDVLLLEDGDKVMVGTPDVVGAKVSARVHAHGRAKKIKIIKFNRRKHHRKQMGHRQSYTELSILDIAVQ